MGWGVLKGLRRACDRSRWKESEFSSKWRDLGEVTPVFELPTGPSSVRWGNHGGPAEMLVQLRLSLSLQDNSHLLSHAIGKPRLWRARVSWGLQAADGVCPRDEAGGACSANTLHIRVAMEMPRTWVLLRLSKPHPTLLIPQKININTHICVHRGV